MQIQKANVLVEENRKFNRIPDVGKHPHPTPVDDMDLESLDAIRLQCMCRFYFLALSMTNNIWKTDGSTEV
jgi:hypothetical protein